MNSSTPPLTRLNLGSGAHCPAGWLHLDNSPGALLGKHPRIASFVRALLGRRGHAWLPASGWGPNCRRMNLAQGLDLPPASADHAYSSHFLEHLTRSEARRLLADCHRVLRPGGRLRLLVPDLRSVVDRYEAARRESPDSAAEIFHAATGYFDYPVPPRPLALPLWLVRRRHNHSFLWDEAALRADLLRAGFGDVLRRGFGDSDIPGILDIEVESRFENSLCLESTRA